VNGVAATQPLADHADDHVVGHKVAARHDRLRAQAQLSAVAHRRSQHVAGGDVGEPMRLGHPRRLRALAGTGRAHEDQIESHRRTYLRKPL